MSRRRRTREQVVRATQANATPVKGRHKEISTAAPDFRDVCGSVDQTLICGDVWRATEVRRYMTVMFD